MSPVPLCASRLGIAAGRRIVSGSRTSRTGARALVGTSAGEQHRPRTQALVGERGGTARGGVRAEPSAVGRGVRERRVAEREADARAARERACEAAAVSAMDETAEAYGRRARRVTFRRKHAAVAKRGANGQLGDIKSLSWSAGRVRQAAVAPVDFPVAGDGWQQAPDGLGYTAVPERRWAKRTPTDTTVGLASAVGKHEREEPAARERQAGRGVRRLVGGVAAGPARAAQSDERRATGDAQLSQQMQRMRVGEGGGHDVPGLTHDCSDEEGGAEATRARQRTDDGHTARGSACAPGSRAGEHTWREGAAAGVGPAEPTPAGCEVMTRAEVRIERERQARDEFGAATRATWSQPVSLTAAAKARDTARTQQADEAAIAAMRATRQAAIGTNLSENSMSGITSAVRFWLEFCAVRGVDPDEFGVLLHDELPRPSQLMAEDEILCDFAAYVVDHPRKKGIVNLRGNTAAEYVSRVLTWYEGRLRPARRPGGAGGLAGANNALGSALRRTLKGLRKMHPSDPSKNRKVPVTRANMMGIKRQLDLSTKFGSMVWAFCTTCWQGGRRAGDIIRGKAVKAPWTPQRDMHRGRVVTERGDGGRVVRVVLQLPPGKTDQTGEEGHEAILPLAHEAEINAAAAIMHMMRLDPLAAGETPSSAPLFRDSRPGHDGRPMTYGAMLRVVKKLLMGAGMSEEDAGCHSFRRGTATSLQHAGESDATMRSIGIWASNAMFGYMDVTKGGAMERAMLRMAETDVTLREGARRGIDRR